MARRFTSLIRSCGAILRNTLLAVVWLQSSLAAAEQPATDAGEPTQAYPLSLGARAFMLPPTGFVGGAGLGLDVSYSLIPNFAVGATATWFFVDQGAEPQYCSRCVTSGNSELLFGEGRLWPQRYVTPYGRFNAGLTHLAGQKVELTAYDENRFAVGAELGVELHYKMLSARAFGFHLQPVASSLDESPLLGFGAQVGVRIP